jgi:hypothetical protein
VSSPQVEIARQQWRAGARRLEEQRADPQLYHRLVAQAGALADELRRRLGQTFTLEELVAEYYRAERWNLEVLERVDPDPGWERHTALVTDAAFEAFARGAANYVP